MRKLTNDSHIKKILFRKEVPYLFTIMVGLLIFFLNNVIESYKDSPALLYKYSIVNSHQIDSANIEENIICTLRNASSSDMLKSVQVNMQYAPALTIAERGIFTLLHDPQITPVSPASDRLDSVVNVYTTANLYFLESIQPNCEYILTGRIVRHKSITEKPKLYISSPYPIRLIGGCEAWFIRHMFIIQLILVVILLSTIVLYFNYIAKN